MMYGRPSRVSLRPDYLTGYMEAVVPEPVVSAGLQPVAPALPMDDMMTVSITPEAEPMLSSNTARLIGVALLIGAVHFFRKRM